MRGQRHCLRRRLTRVDGTRDVAWRRKAGACAAWLGAGLMGANRKDGDDTASTDVLLLVANCSLCGVVTTIALCFSSLSG